MRFSRSPGEDWIDFLKHRQGAFDEARRQAEGAKRREDLWELALAMLKKINPIVQQVAGSWVEGKVTPSTQ